ncbi:hypothetical protein [Paenarthrobacter sp. NPDC018779]
MTRFYREPRDWSYYAGREETEAQQQAKYEDDADSRRKGEDQ